MTPSLVMFGVMVFIVAMLAVQNVRQMAEIDALSERYETLKARRQSKG